MRERLIVMNIKTTLLMCILFYNVIKYICRHQYKDGKQDLEKAKHFIDMIIERDYS